LTSRDTVRLAADLRSHHATADVRTVDLDHADLPAALAAAGPVDRVYHLGGVRAGTPVEEDPGTLAESLRRGMLALFHLARELPGDGRRVHLKIVTSDAGAPADGPVDNPFAAGLHGLA